MDVSVACFLNQALYWTHFFLLFVGNGLNSKKMVNAEFFDFSTSQTNDIPEHKNQ